MTASSNATPPTLTGESTSPSPPADSSEATALGSSSPPAAASSSSKESRSSTSSRRPASSTVSTVFPSPRYQDRIFLTGTTGCGKSELAKRLFLSAPGPRLVIDPADSTMTTCDGKATTFRDPLRPPPADTAIARFVPSDPADFEAYDRVYQWAFEHFPRYLWLDEAAEAMPSSGGNGWSYPKSAPPPRHWGARRRVLVQGRKRQIGHIACHTRPVEVVRRLKGLAQFVAIFDLPDDDDRVEVAKLAGIPLGQLESLLAQLQRVAGSTATGFLWWSQEARRLQLMAPLDVRRR